MKTKLNTNKPIAVIPARGGSKRLPRKNIMDILGIPMLARTIINAKHAEIFSEIYVSTEDPEIAAIASMYGAKIIERSSMLAADDATVDQVISDILVQLEDIQEFACIYATAVLLSPESIRESSEMFFSNSDLAIVGVSESEYHPAEALIVSDDMIVGEFSPMWRHKKSQDYPKVAYSNGTIYWSSRTIFQKENTLVPNIARPYWVKPAEALDINTFKDSTLLVEILERESAAVVDRD